MIETAAPQRSVYARGTMRSTAPALGVRMLVSWKRGRVGVLTVSRTRDKV
jgi:hypothetical protein